MRTLREIASFLDASDEPISLRTLCEQTGFYNISLRDLENYLANIPTPMDDIVKRVCPNRWVLNVGDLKIPYCSNRSPDQQDTAIRRAIIVIHGTKRNATGYYQDMLTAAVGKLHESIILAPHFLTEEDVDYHNLGNDVPFWTNRGWIQGDSSLSTPTNPRSATISSFAVINYILAKWADLNIFPNLQNVVLVGHSAGGQFINRYAAANQERFPTRYIIANPSSYLYLDKQRRSSGTLNQFMIPGAFEQASCPTYNQYKYGLDGLNPYMQAIGSDQIRAQYPQRRVVYLLGEEDNDPNHDDLDLSCSAMLQGNHRFERGTIFYNYIQHYYGAALQGRHTKVTVPGVGHSAFDMFNSPQGIQQIFS